ncbi:hypothetical protein BKA70DRAFT_168910 [Coprinopsis sp. MPI-PUGE-AT-0042]|nr:hypothetical protein BKA70DRAFT_168910 [Coprinopsis sp. MPI-PUGE-AT-0042]
MHRMVAEQAWAPCKDKILVQAFWWGVSSLSLPLYPSLSLFLLDWLVIVTYDGVNQMYCLIGRFFPPPALAILSDKTNKAKGSGDHHRSAMALATRYGSIPAFAAYCFAVRPAPYLGYVGMFISWSWQQVNNYDQGKGLLLTATWLLPIALIFGTWFDHSFPEPPPAPPAPALPTPAPAPGGPVKNSPGTGKPTTEAPNPAPAPAPPSGSTPVANPSPLSSIPAPTPDPNPPPPPPPNSTPVGTLPVAPPTHTW